MLRPEPGTYALILKSHSTETVQVGRWGQLDLHSGYYVYVGSAFGPGGLRARVARHLRRDKQMHWHIDYLRKHVTPVEVWLSYAEAHLEHKWASLFLEKTRMSLIPGFGCSDCRCQSHLFFTTKMPDNNRLGRITRILV